MEAALFLLSTDLQRLLTAESAKPAAPLLYIDAEEEEQEEGEGSGGGGEGKGGGWGRGGGRGGPPAPPSRPGLLLPQTLEFVEFVELNHQSETQKDESAVVVLPWRQKLFISASSSSVCVS